MPAKRRTATPAAPSPVDVLARNTIGPGALIIHRNAGMTRVAEWFERAKLYVDAMDGLDRVVLVHADDDDTLYLSSLPAVVESR